MALPASAPPPEPGHASAVARADQVVRQNPTAIQASASDRYIVHSSKVDADGAAHVRYRRTYQGLPVRGGDFVIHLSPDGAFVGSSVGLASPLALSTTAKVAAGSAAAAAERRFAGTVTEVGAPELLIDASSGRGRLVWETVVSGRAPDGQTPSRLHVVSDAVTGEFIGSFDEVQPGTAPATRFGPAG